MKLLPWLALLTLGSLWTPGDPGTAAGELRVSFQRGDDATGDGTAEAPFRTLTKALSVARASDARRIQLEYGTYEEDEAFPLSLPAGLEVRGIGSGGTVLRAEAGTILAADTGGSAESIVLGELALAGADVGLAVSGARVVLRGVTLDDLGVGVQATTGEAPIWILGRGLRATDCVTGVDAEGVGRLALDLAGSAFERCEVGVLLRAADGVDPMTYAGPGVEHDVRIAGTHFQGCTRSGFERRGASGLNRGAPYRFEDCTFQGNRVGIELVRPGADTPIRVRRSRFLANANFGIRAAGNEGDAGEVSLVSECEFRWNGVGIHMTNSHVVWEIRRSRFLDNVGNALFLANFQTEPLKARVVSSLVAGNGGAGVYTMADGQKIGIDVLYSTIAHNGAGGVHRTTRHSGRSELEITGCIVYGNATDLVKIEPGEVRRSLVGDGSLEPGPGGEGGNLTGDPGFRDAAGRDYRLSPGSRCIDAGEVDFRLGERDLAGLPRVQGASELGTPDLGAFESPGE